MALFTERKLKKLTKYGFREIRRTEKYMQRRPSDFSESVRQEIASAESALKNSMAGEDPGLLAQHLKEYKKTVDKHLPFYKISVVREYAEAIIIALILALIIRTFIVQAFKIPSGSMIPTLLVGDHILVNKFIYGLEIPWVEEKKLVFSKPKRGDIIVFRYPKDPKKDFIKRVFGVPGDTITIKDHKFLINGKEIKRAPEGSYEYKDTLGMKSTFDIYIEDLDGVEHEIILTDSNPGFIRSAYAPTEQTWKVPENKYFMMGDNRDRSNDSRIWGFVDFNNVRGKAMIIYFSWPPKQFLRFAKLVK